MLLPGETAEEMNREAVIWRLLAPWLAPEDGKLWRAATYVFHALVAKDWRRARIFLAGDAAHMTPPFMGQGMCQGIRDAANLAWKIEMVMRGLAGDALLNSYQRERSPHVRTTTEEAKTLGRIVCELDPVKASERDVRMLAETGNTPAAKFFVPGLVEGALCSEQGDPVGQRFPQPRIVSETGEALLDDAVGASFRLVLSSQCPVSHIPEALRRRIVGLGGAILAIEEEGVSGSRGMAQWSIVETQSVLAAWFRHNGLLAALVRPDHYVFAIARQPSDLQIMSDLLDQRLFLTS
jgi:3-(3-hydroxy-phenyl)propionate hydroxylase